MRFHCQQLLSWEIQKWRDLYHLLLCSYSSSSSLRERIMRTSLTCYCRQTLSLCQLFQPLFRGCCCCCENSSSLVSLEDDDDCRQLLLLLLFAVSRRFHLQLFFDDDVCSDDHSYCCCCFPDIDSENTRRDDSESSYSSSSSSFAAAIYSKWHNFFHPSLLLCSCWADVMQILVFQRLLFIHCSLFELLLLLC